MSTNQLIPVKHTLPALVKKDSTVHYAPVVSYSRLDPLHYSFSYNLEDNISVHMEEADNTSGRNEFVDCEFADTVPESYKVYYAVAAASGALTGALSFVQLTEEQLTKANEWKEKNWKKIVIYAAELIGCNKKDYKAASKYLVNQAVRRIQKDATAKEYMTLLAAHPSMAGLVFSLVTQFSQKPYYISESGEITSDKLPRYYFLGNTNGEKVVAAVLYWLFELAANQVESNRRLIDNLGLSGELLKQIKAFVNLPFLQKIPENREQAEMAFSDWLRNVISKAVPEADETTEDAQLVSRLMKMALNLGEDAFPVLINECIVRSLYMLIRICDVAKAQQITSFRELRKVHAADVFLSDDRLLSGMCLIASASFVGVNIAVAALKAIAAAKAGDREFFPAFFTELNIPAIGRLVFSCAKHSKYWGDSIRVFFQRKATDPGKTAFSAEDIYEEYDSEAFASMSFSPAQARMLYCLENLVVREDIQHTKDAKNADAKQDWLDNWRSNIVAGANLSPEMEKAYFLEDEEKLYDGIYQLSKDKNNYPWFYLLTQELALFKPYFTLGCEDDENYKKLKPEYDYVADRFLRRQPIVSQDELENIQSTYKKYMNYLNGKVVKTVSTIAGGAAVTALTGGLALAYAPAIAAMIAGEAVVGLHGAALASASLAFVGGGSLAAGGLGVAGGTAIITGGGALIGLAGSGSAGAMVALMSTSDEYWMRQSAKLLTHCKCNLCDALSQKQTVESLLKQVKIAATRVSAEVDMLKREDNDLDKEYLKRLDSYLGCLKKTQAELQRLVK